MPDAPPAYDVAIIGGGLAGAATAILLLQGRPGWRVVIIDRGSRSHGGLGEALPELTAYFLGRSLGLGAHLNERHYTRQGSRFWFTNGDPAQTFDASSEIGSKYLVRLPTFLVDRTVLDAKMLRRAAELGAEIRQPATVANVNLSPGGTQTLTLATSDEVRARWVVDASGAAAVLSRSRGALLPATPPRTKVTWSRWRGVQDWDAPELRRAYPEWAAACFGMRNPAINYLTGDGWWSGWTPVRGGEVSIRTAGDRRLIDLPEDTRTFLEERHPVAREMLKKAVLVEGSSRVQEGASSACCPPAGDGFAAVGRAAGFVDPLYGRHLDWTSSTVAAAADLILSGRPGVGFRSAESFDAVAGDKYGFLGEFDLMRVAYPFHLGMYTLAVARAPYQEGARRLLDPPPLPAIVGWVNRRCSQIARVRRARGRLGQANAGKRALFTSFNFHRASAGPLVGAALRWLRLELTEGWRSWLKP